MIGVVDYRAGNAPSVMYALDRVGVPARLVAAPAELRRVDHIVLPGVGAAGATMASLAESELVAALTERVRGDAIPFLGICIGLQVIFDHSEEGDVTTLGWVPGRVHRFPADDRVPQIGWNRVRATRPHPLLAGLPDEPYCYFVNSFYAEPAQREATLATTDYSVEFTSMVAAGNIAATQFHAEKSGEVGLRILENFARWDGAPC
jgi:glutamine amidotransferase